MANLDTLERVIIMRLGEIFLKGKNRGSFEKILIGNIKAKMADVACKLSFERNRYIISNYSEADVATITNKLKTVFGLHSFSQGVSVPSDFEVIASVSKDMLPDHCSFRVTANRGDKTFAMNSMEIARALGERLVTQKKGMRVDLHNAEYDLNVDVREEGKTYLFFDRTQGAGGMPVGSAGKGLLLLSGGIDSPVAAYSMAKRGLLLDAIHFHSYPYTSAQAQEKVEKLKKVLENYCGKMPLTLISFTKIQEAIHKHCSESFMITIMRRCMMRIAMQVAKERNCGCLVNGESLGQVASQTLESITVTNAVVGEFPVLRPLIGNDKQEIIEVSKKIGCYEISIEPFEDCCTVFLPAKPVIKPRLSQCLLEEKRIPNLDALLEETIESMEVV